MGVFIEDGYTAEKAIAARPGLYPAATVRFRPALARKRAEYQKAFGTNDPAKIATFENALIDEHVTELDGEKVPKGKGDRIVPELRSIILNLILGYEAADEASDAGN